MSSKSLGSEGPLAVDGPIIQEKAYTFSLCYTDPEGTTQAYLLLVS